jgi:hypothetical protein
MSRAVKTRAVADEANRAGRNPGQVTWRLDDGSRLVAYDPRLTDVPKQAQFDRAEQAKGTRRIVLIGLSLAEPIAQDIVYDRFDSH